MMHIHCSPTHQGPPVASCALLKHHACQHIQYVCVHILLEPTEEGRKRGRGGKIKWEVVDL